MKIRTSIEERARALRHTRPALELCQFENLDSELQNILDFCYEHEYADVSEFFSEEDSDYAQELQLSISLLAEKAEHLQETFEYETGEHFDTLMSCVVDDDLVGYDSFQEDYYPLNDYETELARESSRKKLMKLTKAELLDLMGNFTILVQFLQVRDEYQNLKLIFDVAADRESGIREMIRKIDETWNDCETENWYDWKPAVRKFDRLTENLPDRIWVEC